VNPDRRAVLGGEPPNRQPLAKALTLLTAMVDSPENSWGVRELARLSGMSPPTVHRLLAALLEEGFVAFDGNAGRYALGIEFMRLALKSTSKLTLPEAVRPYLRELSESYDESAFLSVYDARRREAMFVASVESSHALRYVVRLYEWMPIRLGASGLAILAFLPEAEQREILSAGASRATAGEGLVDDLDAIRRAGFARTEGQRVPGAVGIAAPIFGSDGSVAGDVGLSVPVQRIASFDERELAADVVRCASRISHELGGLFPSALRVVHGRSEVQSITAAQRNGES
jgi:IclR family transcriptional regulator, acetate operon repressor